jgi:hypothetical protein
MIQKLIETNAAEVARIHGVLSFRTWDEVTDDFNDWRAVDFDVLKAIQDMAGELDDDVAGVLVSESTYNLSSETALAIVQAVRLK